MLPPSALPSRRDFLCQYGGGFAGLALTHLLARDLPASPSRFPSASSPLPHHPPKVRRVIQLFMNGGISQVDSFLYRPELQKRAGQKDDGKNLFASPFAFAQHGQCGRWISSVFPHHAREVDKMTFLLGMHTDNNIHGTSSYMMNTGFMRAGFPCLGAWVSYGLGQLSENLPAFVVLPDKVGMPYNGEGNFTSGFLSPSHQGTVVRTGERTPIADLFANPRHSFVNPNSDQDGLALLTSLNRSHLATRPADPRLEARIASYEMAARMQLSAPEAFDLSQETPATQAAYGIGSPLADDFGRRCLLARRLVERGVRFVQVWSGHDGPVNNWDNHFDVPKNFPIQAQKVDQPAAALLADLHQRGLLEDTLLLFCTEFGRTPTGQMVGTHPPGRDHNGKSFAIWMAGAGLRPGFAFGDADEFGAKATTDATDHHDLHATILHLLGIDHTQLSVLHNGVNRRLTDVHGRVIHEIFA